MNLDVPSRRIVVTGDRGWVDRETLILALQRELSAGEFILGVGDCPTGADAFALEWGRGNLGFPVMVFCAPWEIQGRAAGPVRNWFMVEQFRPQLILAFITPQSRGTVNCANYAESQGIAVRRFFGRRADAQEADVQADRTGPGPQRVRTGDEQAPQPGEPGGQGHRR